MGGVLELRSRRDRGLVTRSPKPVTDYAGVRNASCTYPQRPESSPGDDVAAQGANPRVAVWALIGARSALEGPRAGSHPWSARPPKEVRDCGGWTRANTRAGSL